MSFVPLCFGIAAAALSFLLPQKFAAITTFTLESSSQPGLSGNLAALAGIAGQFDVGLGATQGNLSPDFLASVLDSRELLESTLNSEFADPHAPSERRSLLSLIDAKGKTVRERMSNGVRRLGGLARASVERKTGIITLRVELGDRELAAAVANRMIELLDRFNVDQRQTQSRQQRKFVASRLADTEGELHSAEQSQVRFLELNRQFAISPLLKFQADSLAREVEAKQEVYLALTKAYEDARIAEVRDTPSITVIDTAVPVDKPTAPHRFLIVLAAVCFGIVVGVACAYLREYPKLAAREDRADYRAFADAWARARSEVVTALGRSGR